MSASPRTSDRSLNSLPAPTQAFDRTSTPTGSQKRQTTGSATQTINTNTPERPGTLTEPLVLRLRGTQNAAAVTRNTQAANEEEDDTDAGTRLTRRRRIRWDEDVVDNEGLGRKKSKVCCIYHKPRAVGESSDESSSDSSSSDSDSDSDTGREDGARPATRSGGSGRGRGKGERRHTHDRDDDGDCNGHDHDHDHGPCKRKQRRRPSPNEYERMPKYDVKPLEKQPGT